MLRIVAGPPFAGKTQHVESEIAKREKAGERGLVLIDFTQLYLAMFPGEADKVLLMGAGLTDNPSYRDTPVEVREDEPPRRRRLWL